jgi:hypothetical protein
VRLRRFDLFVHIIDRTPTNTVLDAIKLEHWMLEDDLLYKRVAETREVDSILHFCQFIAAVTEEDKILPVKLPAKHITFYRNVLLRLIEAGELPATAKEQFNDTFGSDYLKAIAC